MKIINTTRGDLGLSHQHVVPAGGSIEIEPDVAKKLAHSKVVQAWIESGSLVAEGVEPVSSEPVAPQATREQVIADIIAMLGEDDFTKGGKPEVDAINDAMPQDAEPVTADERDAVWSSIEAQKAG